MLFIFEMANNHQGDIAHGLRIIEAMSRIAQKHRISAAVKFQYRDLDTFIHPDCRDSDGHIARFLSTRLSEHDFCRMVEDVRAGGMKVACTPFDETSVGKVVDHGYDIIKVASCSAHDWPLLGTVAAARKPTIVSTGGLTLYDIDKTFTFFTNRDITPALLHCVAEYPAEWFDMSFMDKIRRRYPTTVGYSGHEAPENLNPVRAAVAKGAEILERHVGIGQLNKYSMNPEQTEAWVRAVLEMQEVCGDGTKRESQKELEALHSLKRGVYARDIIRKGEITGGRVFFAMPCKGMSVDEYTEEIPATQDYAPRGAIEEARPAESALTRAVREAIHDAKGMLNEAQIHLGDDYTVELSHHYGMAEFRRFGALIVNIINREYCKKLIVMLPGQIHPAHYHKAKEETFQLLWGDLKVVLHSAINELRPGDKILVERDKYHSFGSEQGAIFEEISTHHVVGDSYYQDPGIAQKDPMLRKTVLEVL